MGNSQILWIPVVALVLLAGGLMLLTLSSRRTTTQIRDQESRFQTAISQVRDELARELGRLNSSLLEGVSSSGKAIATAQQSMAEQLLGSQKMMQRLSEQLGAVQEAGRDLSQTASILQNVLGGAKTRGILGEMALEKLLSDALAKGAYERQYRFATGEVVDAVVRVGDHLLPIDSKFPLEAYRRMVEGGESSRQEFIQAVRKHADSIAQKYIRPQDGTLEFALMFVPSEGVYYELLASENEKIGALAEYCRAEKVFPVSPNSFYAYLMLIVLGQKGLKLAENTRQLMGQLSGLQKELDGFGTVFGKLGTHLRNARQNYEDAEARLAQVSRSAARLASGSLAGDDANRTTDLPLAPPKE